jgi:hypothetical protein
MIVSAGKEGGDLWIRPGLNFEAWLAGIPVSDIAGRIKGNEIACVRRRPGFFQKKPESRNRVQQLPGWRDGVIPQGVFEQLNGKAKSPGVGTRGF